MPSNEIKQGVFDVAFLDLRLGTRNGLDLIPYLQFHSPRAKIVIITAYASIDSAIEAMRKGATDYLPKPFTPAQIKMVIDKIREISDMQRQIDYLKSSLTASMPEIDFSTKSAAMQKVFAIAQEAASSSATILLKGESGSGKSVLAKAIHDWSPRAGKPFLSVSCPSLSARAPGERAFRPCQGFIHRRAQGFPRTDLAGPGRHAVPRRDRRPAPGDPTQAPALHPGKEI